MKSNKTRNILGSLLVLVSVHSTANDISPYEFPPEPPTCQEFVNGTSSIWELHVILNDGLDTHLVHRSGKMSLASREFERLSYRGVDHIKEAWIGRGSVKIKLK